jgi:hypothetical protein
MVVGDIPVVIQGIHFAVEPSASRPDRSAPRPGESERGRGLFSSEAFQPVARTGLAPLPGKHPRPSGRVAGSMGRVSRRSGSFPGLTEGCRMVRQAPWLSSA